MKAMRRRIALPNHFVRNSPNALFRFAKAFGVRTRPRVALVVRRQDLPLITTAAIAAFGIRFCRRLVILAFGFFRVAQGSARAIKRLGFGQWYIDNRIDELEELTIG